MAEEASFVLCSRLVGVIGMRGEGGVESLDVYGSLMRDWFLSRAPSLSSIWRLVALLFSW